MSETISRPFTFVKEGVFYFSRRIPKELRDHYTSPRIAYSWRTKSPKIAKARARKAARFRFRATIAVSFWLSNARSLSASVRFSPYQTSRGVCRSRSG